MMIQRQLFATFALLPAAAGVADVEIDPLTTRLSGLPFHRGDGLAADGCRRAGLGSLP